MAPTIDNGTDGTADVTTRAKNPGLTQFMTMMIGACCLFSAFINLQQAHTEGPVPTALHHAVEEFRMSGRTPKEVEVDSQSGNILDGADEAAYEHKPWEGLGSDHSNNKARFPELTCQDYGGPDPIFAQEMVYWEDIPSDSTYVSPFRAKRGERTQYLTFEPDGGGWNNIRMALEVFVGLAVATGRTLVMPPAQRMYLLGKDRDKQRTHFSFADFFPMYEMARDNAALDIISHEEFLKKEAMTGHLKDKKSGKTSFPPENRTNWDGGDSDTITHYKEWLRSAALTPTDWGPDHCLAAFPASGDHKDIETLNALQKQIHSEGLQHTNALENPNPVDATPLERMREDLSGRKRICVYDEKMQSEPVVHLMCYHKMRVRFLTHFYSYLFFEDWRENLWMKRFIRDHMRYIDEIQCAAARIVHSMREYAKSKGVQSGEFDTFHVRRGDFQFKRTRIEADEIYENTKEVLTPGAIIYIATDERNKKFFDPMAEHYDLKFMDDFMDELKGVNTNYYGMIDQLVASRGRLFFGCWHSTFTGYINRLRGYHSVKDKAPGHENGLLPNTYYYVPKENLRIMHEYSPIGGAHFNREFPTSWRDLDKGIGELPIFEDS